MCDPILVTLLKMLPHYSQSSRENATPSGGTSPLASYKEVPPPPDPCIAVTPLNRVFFLLLHKFGFLGFILQCLVLTFLLFVCFSLNINREL